MVTSDHCASPSVFHISLPSTGQRAMMLPNHMPFILSNVSLQSARIHTGMLFLSTDTDISLLQKSSWFIYF